MSSPPPRPACPKRAPDILLCPPPCFPALQAPRPRLLPRQVRAHLQRGYSCFNHRRSGAPARWADRAAGLSGSCGRGSALLARGDETARTRRVAPRPRRTTRRWPRSRAIAGSITVIEDGLYQPTGPSAGCFGHQAHDYPRSRLTPTLEIGKGLQPMCEGGGLANVAIPERL
jgi:hypothetical protein